DHAGFSCAAQAMRRRRPAAESPRAPAGGWREVADGHPCLLKPATWRVGAASAAIMAMQVAAEAAPTPRLQPFAVELAVTDAVAEVDQATQRHPDHEALEGDRGQAADALPAVGIQPRH